MLVDCEARLYVLDAIIWDLLQSWGTLGWECEHSETDPGHWLARRRRRNDSPLWSRCGTVTVTVTSRRDMLCSLATLGGVSSAGLVNAGLRTPKSHPPESVKIVKIHQWNSF